MACCFAKELARWWRESETCAPKLERVYPEAEQNAREAEMDRFLDAVSLELRRPPKSRDERAAAEERLTAAFRRFAARGLGFDSAEVELLVSGGFTRTARDLAQSARQLDPGVSAEDIFQAARNAWTTNGLQAILGLPVRLTPAVFAYSMLYPYTDNYLDSPGISRQAKESFNARFGCRLAGDGTGPCGAREETIWRLVGLIERQYDRRRYPEVFDSLLAIHRAQARSVLLHRCTGRDDPDVLLIGFEKGGASVLADAWLAAGTLTPAEAQFAFAWGALLQLGDDAQDVERDAEDGILTMFSQGASRGPLDSVMNRVFQFGEKVFELLDPLGGSETMKALMEQSAYRLLIEAAGSARHLYSPSYIAGLERHSPFRFSFLSGRRERVLRYSKPLAKLLEALADDSEVRSVATLYGTACKMCVP
jgi:hypothetical protein